MPSFQFPLPILSEFDCGNAILIGLILECHFFIVRWPASKFLNYTAEPQTSNAQPSGQFRSVPTVEWADETLLVL